MKLALAALALITLPLAATAEEAIELPGGEYMLAYHNGKGVVCHIEDGCTNWKQTSAEHKTSIVRLVAGQEILDFIQIQRLSGKPVPKLADAQKLLSADWTNYFDDLYDAANKHRTTF